jgi:SHS2 domain-containing protein
MQTYGFLEHGGEVEIELESASEAGLFEAALGSFAELSGTGGADATDSASHEVDLAASDDALLLVDWLSELVFLAEVEQFIPERVAALELANGRLRATVMGYRGRPRQLVKAITLNGLSVEQKGGSWHGHVVLDV